MLILFKSMFLIVADSITSPFTAIGCSDFPGSSSCRWIRNQFLRDCEWPSLKPPVIIMSCHVLIKTATRRVQRQVKTWRRFSFQWQRTFSRGLLTPIPRPRYRNPHKLLSRYVNPEFEILIDLGILGCSLQQLRSIKLTNRVELVRLLRDMLAAALRYSRGTDEGSGKGRTNQDHDRYHLWFPTIFLIN